MLAPRKFSDDDLAGHSDASRIADDGRATKGGRFFKVLPGRSMTLQPGICLTCRSWSVPLLDWPLRDRSQRDQISQHDAATRRIGCPHLQDGRDDPQVCPWPRRKLTTPAGHPGCCGGRSFRLMERPGQTLKNLSLPVSRLPFVSRLVSSR